MTAVEITDCRRLGPYDREKASSKPRPLRLTYVRSQIQRGTILKAAHKLKNCSETKDIVLRKDLTPLQRDEEKKLEKDMAGKKAASTEQGDFHAKWIRKNGKVVNIGNYPETASNFQLQESNKKFQEEGIPPVVDLQSKQNFPDLA